MTLSVTRLFVSYSRIAVCRDISLEVPNGEFLTILGMNGAGKSSLLGAIAGVVNSRGGITVNGNPLENLPARQRAKMGLALVPEGRRNLFPPMSVDDNLRLGLRFLSRSDQQAMRERIYELFPILRKRGNQPSGSLSGGEQQMLALAVAIARRPSVLLLDEPTQGLAPVVLDEILEAVRGLRSMGLSLLLAEQNHRFAERLADRLIFLKNGRIVDGDSAANSGSST